MTWKRASGCDSGTCVEVLMPWRSADSGFDGDVIVRSSKDPTKTIAFDVEEWQAFVNGVKEEEFDL